MLFLGSDLENSCYHMVLFQALCYFKLYCTSSLPSHMLVVIVTCLAYHFFFVCFYSQLPQVRLTNQVRAAAKILATVGAKKKFRIPSRRTPVERQSFYRSFYRCVPYRTVLIKQPTPFTKTVKHFRRFTDIFWLETLLIAISAS